MPGLPNLCGLLRKTKEDIFTYWLSKQIVLKKPILTGDVITDARQDFDERNNATVSMTMNAQGAKKWQKITKEASSASPKRCVAVSLDSYIYSYPTVNGEIPTGNTQIVGNFTIQEAQDLANILKAGKLPAPPHIIQADVVGPSLGQEAINSGLWSFIIAPGNCNDLYGVLL